MTERELRRDEGIRVVKLLRVIVIGFIWSLFFVVMIPIAVYTLPDLEAAWWPPIKAQRITKKHLKPGDDAFLLWEWSFIKQRRAEPQYMTFMAYLPETPQERYAVDTYIGWDCRQNFRSDRTSAPSSYRVTREVCVRLPDRMRGRADAMIDGVFDFNVGHSLYTVPVRIPASTDDQSIPAPLADPK